jgi:hypothetical protein
MRVRITQCGHGEINGVALSAFEVGRVYDLPLGLGSYLVMLGCAEVVTGDAESSSRETAETRIAVVADTPLAVAADQPKPAPPEPDDETGH